MLSVHGASRTAVGIVLATLIIALPTLQWGYALEKAKRFKGCANFSQMEVVDTVSNHKKTLVMLGDSRVHQWPTSRLERHYRVVNWGVSGATVAELLCGIGRTEAWRGADIYLIQIGINDLVAANATHRLSSKKRHKREILSSTELTRLVEKIASTGKETILLDVVPPIKMDVARKFAWGTGVAASTSRFNTVQETHLYPPNVRYEVISPLFLEEKSQLWRTEFAHDSLHWRPNAYQAIEKKIFNIE